MKQSSRRDKKKTTEKSEKLAKSYAITKPERVVKSDASVIDSDAKIAIKTHDKLVKSDISAELEKVGRSDENEHADKYVEDDLDDDDDDDEDHEYDEEDAGLDKKGMMIRHFIIELLKKINK